mgnify:FL=1
MSTHPTNGVSNKGPVPEPKSEVKPVKAKRRTFTAKQKLKILAETDGLEHGELGAYLRRHGIYSSSLTTWRRQKEEGTLSMQGAPKRGRTPKSSEAKELEKLRRENEKLKKKLEQADLIITAQKKLCEIYSQEPEMKEGSK